MTSNVSMFQVKDVVVMNESNPNVPIQTGIGYLDHMIDQWNSHAQVGVGLKVENTTVTTTTIEQDNASGDSNFGDVIINDDHNRLAGCNQVELCTVVGNALGQALKEKVLISKTGSPFKSRFCCPLDEALVECQLLCEPTSNGNESIDSNLVRYTLPPYGIYPRGVGRTKIGQLDTFAMQSFWKALADSSKLQISLHKIRGDNGHHIVESSFKAFSRALRRYLDPPDFWDLGSPNDKTSIDLHREGKVERTTKETSISVHLLLNGTSKYTHVETGIPMLNAFYTQLAQEAHMTLKIHCKGDLWVDDHHTAEDVSIAVGQCLTQALGTKAGLNRMWVADATYGSPPAFVEVTMDLSNRPCFVHNLHDTLAKQEYVEGQNHNDDIDPGMSPLSCEMLEHSLDSLVSNGRMTVHIVEVRDNKSDAQPSVTDVVMCTAMAFGRALRICSMVDQRRAGTTASSKGTLSV